VFGHLNHLQHAIDLGPGQADQATGQVQVLPAGQISVEAVRLQQRPDLARRSDPVAAHIDPAHARRPAGRPDQAQQHLQRGGLAGPVPPQKAVDRLLRHGHRHRVDGQMAFEAAGQFGRLDGGGHGGRSGFV
jgi:hypothetical protein